MILPRLTKPANTVLKTRSNACKSLLQGGEYGIGCRFRIRELSIYGVYLWLTSIYLNDTFRPLHETPSA